MFEQSYNMLEFAYSMIKDCKKVSTQPYLDWLLKFMDTEEYKVPVNEYIALNMLLKDEHTTDKRIALIDKINPPHPCPSPALAATIHLTPAPLPRSLPRSTSPLPLSRARYAHGRGGRAPIDP
jgi:hypothetical protein